MRRMFRPIKTALAGAGLTALLTTARAEVTSTRMLEEIVPVGSEQMLVVVGNVFGSVRVTAHDRGTVEMKATETIRGDLQSDIDRARAEVELRTETEDGRIAFRVRRVGDDAGDCDCRHWRWDGYVVAYDIELNVPRNVAIDLTTVNDGEIVVDGVHGDFDVSNVNGGVRLVGLRGSGRIATVNGAVDVSFGRVPVAATSFKTINGRVEVTFPEDLAADLEFKTVRGEIYTDFEVEPIARDPAGERTREDGTLVIRAQQASAVRVASGGPIHSFTTLNGDILVRKAGR